MEGLRRSGRVSLNRHPMGQYAKGIVNLMAFSISFLDEPVFYDEETPMAPGELVLGDHKENFVASLYQWKKDNYEAQWRDAIRTLLEGSKSALIVHYMSPEFSDNFEWRPMYKEEDVVYFQNQLPWYDQLTQRFSPENLISFVRDRITVNEDGDRFSEWSMPLSEVEDFYRTLTT